MLTSKSQSGSQTTDGKKDNPEKQDGRDMEKNGKEEACK